METKLTLRLSNLLIQQAKRYSAESGKSVSRLVADFFALLAQPVLKDEVKLTPKVKSLIGILHGKSIHESDYRQYLTNKYK